LKRKTLLWGILGIAIVAGIVVGFTNMQPTAPVQAKTNQSVTLYNQWKKAYVAGGSKKYVKSNNSQGATKVISEGQGYGMLATVLAAKKGANTHTTFNQLYSYYHAHRISSKNPLMSWEQTSRRGRLTSVGSEKNSATDGDLDIAYSLILADKKWGSKKTNYKAAAKALLAAIKKREINKTTYLPKMGNWATSSYDQSKLRTSDLMTGYFKTFAKYTKDRTWTKVASQSQKAIVKLSARNKSGLFPDFIKATGKTIKLSAVKPYQIESGRDNQYGYNACRVPWRLAQTYLITKDGTTKRVLKKQLAFFNKRKKITAVYTMSGKAVNNYANTAFTAPVNMAARTLKQTSLKKKTAKQLPKSIEKKNYFSATLQVVTGLQ